MQGGQCVFCESTSKHSEKENKNSYQLINIPLVRTSLSSKILFKCSVCIFLLLHEKLSSPVEYLLVLLPPQVYWQVASNIFPKARIKTRTICQSLSSQYSHKNSNRKASNTKLKAKRNCQWNKQWQWYQQKKTRCNNSMKWLYDIKATSCMTVETANDPTLPNTARSLWACSVKHG